MENKKNKGLIITIAILSAVLIILIIIAIILASSNDSSKKKDEANNSHLSIDVDKKKPSKHKGNKQDTSSDSIYNDDGDSDDNDDNDYDDNNNGYDDVDNKPGSNKPGSNKPGSDKLGDSKPTNIPTSAPTSTPKPNDIKPDNPKPDDPRPDNPRPDNPRPDNPKPNPETIKKNYKAFIDENFDNIVTAVVADVTHDGNLDLVLVTEDESVGMIWGYVITEQNGTINIIEEKFGGTSHVAGFFSWYLIDNKDGTYNLCEETFGMWQGMGKLTLDQYYINKSGNRILTNSISLSTEDPANTDSDGFVTDSAMKAFERKVGEVIKASYNVYHTESNSSEKAKKLPSDLVIY